MFPGEKSMREFSDESASVQKVETVVSVKTLNVKGVFHATDVSTSFSN